MRFAERGKNLAYSILERSKLGLAEPLKSWHLLQQLQHLSHLQAIPRIGLPGHNFGDAIGGNPRYPGLLEDRIKLRTIELFHLDGLPRDLSALSLRRYC